MLERLRFYIRHSINDLRVNGRRTFFALLCIAAGVAAIVSLQTLAVMIGDTLDQNLQESNRGDIAALVMLLGQDNLESAAQEGLVQQQPPSLFAAFGNGPQYFMPPAGLEKITTWLKEEYGSAVTVTGKQSLTDLIGVFFGNGIGTTATLVATGDDTAQLSPIMVDPSVYPLYGSVKTIDGKGLAAALVNPTDIVFDQKSADNLGVKVGDVVKLNGSSAEFTVQGIVPTEAEITNPASGIINAIFGFYYLRLDAADLFPNVTPTVTDIYIKVSSPDQIAAINSAFTARYPFLETTTIDDMRVQNEAVSGQVSQLVSVVGLVSLLLGSIGIINTMQVIVRRRTVEVAVLKTIGLQGNQVTVLFLVEAVIMGIIGSIFGVLLGWVTTFVIKGVAETLVAQPLAFRITLPPVINGIVVGTLVTTIFGFLPTLAAGRVRPAVVLRPQDNIVPRAGCLTSILALAFMIVALALVANTILGNIGLSFGVTIGAFWGAAFLLVGLLIVIWVIATFAPSFGVVDLKISLRQLSAGRTRAAITLLALVVGVFSLSLITLLADSVNTLLKTALETGSGGNVFIVATSEGTLTQIESVLKANSAVKQYNTVRSYSGTLVSLEEPTGILTAEQLKERIAENSSTFAIMFGPPTPTAEAGASGQPDSTESEFDISQIYLNSLQSLTGRDATNAPEVQIAKGRALTADDAGKAVAVVQDGQIMRSAGIDVGDKLTYRFGEGENAPTVTYEIVGMAQQQLISAGFSGGNGLTIPYDSLPAGVQTQSIQVFVSIDDAQIKQLRKDVSRIPGAFVLETAVLTKLVSSLLGTFTAFPTMVALLGLIVGGVVIANSVALTTMERRREIAVMKSIGMHRERVLGMILLENGILGLIGGLVGVGICLLILTLLYSTGGSSGALGIQAIPYGTALLLMGLCVLIALIAALTTAWGASGEKPLNVLRYE